MYRRAGLGRWDTGGQHLHNNMLTKILLLAFSIYSLYYAND